MTRHEDYCFSKASCIPNKFNFPTVPKNNNVYKTIKARSWWFCGKIKIIGFTKFAVFILSQVWPVTQPLHANTGPTVTPIGHATSSRAAASAKVRIQCKKILLTSYP